MRFTTICVASLVLLAPAALAGSDAKSPLKLALQASDLPANLYTLGVKPRPLLQDPATTAILGVPGVRAADYAYSYPADPSHKGFLGSSPKEWRLEGTVFVAPSPVKARDLFRRGTVGPYRTGFFSDVPGVPKDHVNVSLPSYGQRQTAVFVRRFPTVGPQAILFVLKGSVVWQLRVQTVSRQWNPPRATVLAELKKYASKQKVRVGNG